jgi:predicted ATPase/DNA-binding CsgD family transcriptional regulator
MKERNDRRSAARVPVAVTTFVGRQREMAEVRRRLAGSRLVTLTGPGGVGKTRLAMQVAAELDPDYANGAWFAELAAISDPHMVGLTIASTLGLRHLTAQDVGEVLVSYLGERELLLVVDNCEHLIDECAHLLAELLRRCPGLTVLTTSRTVLGTADETVLTVPPLSVAAGQPDARQLLVDRVRAFRPDFEVTAENRAALDTICTRLDGVPLTIELAASRLRVLAADQLVDRLRHRFTVLTGGSRSALPRQQTLRALIDWSHDLCTPAERTLWARLAGMQGSFDIEAAEEICADPGSGAPTVDDVPVLDLVDRLVAQSVLGVETQGDVARYRMLETLREYGLERLRESGEELALRERHRDHFLDRAEGACREWCGPGQARELRRQRDDQDNLRAALAFSAGELDGGVSLLRLSAALRYHWFVNGHLGEGRRWLERALQTTDDAPADRAVALWVAAWVAVLQGDDAGACAHVEACRGLAGEIGDVDSLAYADHVAGTAALFRGDLREAVAAFESADREHAVAGAPEGRLGMLFQLAMAHAHLGESRRARDICDEAIDLADAHGEKWGRSYAMWVLAYVTWCEGDADLAEELALASLSDKSQFADHVGSALVIELLSWIAVSVGRAERAARRFAAATLVWDHLGTAPQVFGPQLAARHDEAWARTARELGSTKFEAVVAGEQRRSVEEAINVVLEPITATRVHTGDGVLTPREWEIAELVGKGFTSKQIAEKLVVSARTVDAHVEHIRTKLGVSSRTQIAVWLVENHPRRERMT